MIATAGDLLARLTAASRPLIPDKVAVVVAHPDDETLGCGALLARLANLTIVHVTDGAPRDMADARRHGFADAFAYAAARRAEVEAALSIAGVSGARLVAFGLPDQGAAPAMADIARRLVPLLGDVDLVLTHAYEGGHPDHDATAFAVQAAATMLAGQGRNPAIVEMSLYRAGPDGSWLRQQLEEGARLSLTGAERRRKGRMLAVHATQRETLAAFRIADESYRIAQSHDFARAPNGGAVLYDGQPWGMTSSRFAALAVDALLKLGLDTPP